MKFIADGLTAFRVLSAAIILLLAWHNMWQAATALFVLGILSDAFDGIAARRWPYTEMENEQMWWRKDPHLLDNMSDLALSGAAMLSLTLSLLPLWGAITTVVLVGLTSFVIQTTVDKIGKTDPVKAEKIDVAHGWLYGCELVAMLIIMTALATEFWPVVVLVYAVATVPLLWLKWDRVTSRSELTYG